MVISEFVLLSTAKFSTAKHHLVCPFCLLDQSCLWLFFASGALRLRVFTLKGIVLCIIGLTTPEIWLKPTLLAWTSYSFWKLYLLFATFWEMPQKLSRWLRPHKVATQSAGYSGTKYLWYFYAQYWPRC